MSEYVLSNIEYYRGCEIHTYLINPNEFETIIHSFPKNRGWFRPKHGISVQYGLGVYEAHKKVKQHIDMLYEQAEIIGLHEWLTIEN